MKPNNNNSDDRRAQSTKTSISFAYIVSSAHLHYSHLNGSENVIAWMPMDAIIMESRKEFARDALKWNVGVDRERKKKQNKENFLAVDAGMWSDDGCDWLSNSRHYRWNASLFHWFLLNRSVFSFCSHIALISMWNWNTHVNVEQNDAMSWTKKSSSKEQRKRNKY